MLKNQRIANAIMLVIYFSNVITGNILTDKKNWNACRENECIINNLLEPEIFKAKCLDYFKSMTNGDEEYKKVNICSINDLLIKYYDENKVNRLKLDLESNVKNIVIKLFFKNLKCKKKNWKNLKNIEDITVKDLFKLILRFHNPCLSNNNLNMAVKTFFKFKFKKNSKKYAKAKILEILENNWSNFWQKSIQLLFKEYLKNNNNNDIRRTKKKKLYINNLPTIFEEETISNVLDEEKRLNSFSLLKMYNTIKENEEYVNNLDSNSLKKHHFRKNNKYKTYENLSNISDTVRPVEQEIVIDGFYQYLLNANFSKVFLMTDINGISNVFYEIVVNSEFLRALYFSDIK